MEFQYDEWSEARATYNNWQDSHKMYQLLLILASFIRQMVKIRSFLYGFILIAYSLSLAHSVVPHQHFDSYRDFKEDHSHKEAKHEHPDSHDEEEGSLFFNTHVANIDFSPTTFTFNKTITKKNQQVKDTLVENTSLFDACFVDPPFHIPIEPLWHGHFFFSSRLLRAPPVFS